ncbi:hypothetical protein ACFL1G_06985, partial [Planctomycetota bacterium]
APQVPWFRIIGILGEVARGKKGISKGISNNEQGMAMGISNNEQGISNMQMACYYAKSFDF